MKMIGHTMMIIFLTLSAQAQNISEHDLGEAVTNLLLTPKMQAISKTDVTVIGKQGDGRTIGYVSYGPVDILVTSTQENPENFMPMPQCSIFAERCRTPKEYLKDFPNIDFNFKQLQFIAGICYDRLSEAVLRALNDTQSGCIYYPESVINFHQGHEKRGT